jgi:hypothetical protein
MIRFTILACLLTFAIGCSSATEQNAPATNKVDSATYTRPVEEKLGTTTMKEFTTASGLKAYPGSESATGENFSHGDGVTKSVLTFSTKDSVEKIAEFYKAEGMDVKIPTKPIGMTKAGAQVMISIQSDQAGSNTVKITGLVSGKKSP